MSNKTIKEQIEYLEDDIAANERFFVLHREAGNLSESDMMMYEELVKKKLKEIETLKSKLNS